MQLPLVRLMQMMLLPLLYWLWVLEAQTVEELVDNERDERARMTYVECAAKVVERGVQKTKFEKFLNISRIT
jgi:hypothetical protein